MLLLFVIGACGDDPTSVDFVPPVVDGVRSPGEWASATQVEAFEGATFMFMSDATNLYLAFEVEDAALDHNDRFEVRFDNNRNGMLDNPENNLRINGAQVFSDAHSEGGNWGAGDSQSHGTGAAGEGDGVLFFEIVQPLNSGEEEDFALMSGDRLGYCVIFGRNGTSSDGTAFPFTCQTFGADLSNYAEIVIE